MTIASTVTVLVLATTLGAMATVACGPKSSEAPLANQSSVETGAIFGPADFLSTGFETRDDDLVTAAIVRNGHPRYGDSLKMSVKRPTAETNAAQLTVVNKVAVKKGDVLLIRLAIRGFSASGNRAQAEILFERSTSPWTKSITHPVFSAANEKEWKEVAVACESAEDYAPGQVMTSVRVAFGVQIVELAGLSVQNYGKSVKVDDLQAKLVSENKLGAVKVTFNFAQTKQTMMGLGGNFCQPRYGRTESLDPVGKRALEELKPVHARVGIPLNHWMPEKGKYNEGAQAKACMEAMAEFRKRGIPIVASVWEGPVWLQGGNAEQSGRVLPPERYADCIDGITAFLVKAKRDFSVEAEYFSFNEPDYGVNFKFSQEQMIAFLKQTAKKFASAGLKTKFVVGDTANGVNLVNFATPILNDPTLKPYLGPIAFHSWDGLSAGTSAYTAIAELGKKHNKEIWCLEAGHDAQLWQAKNPWESWSNALRTAMAYERTIRLTGATLMDYWTYQDNYPLVSADGTRPFPVFMVMKEMAELFGPRTRVSNPAVSSEEIQAIGTVDRAGKRRAMVINPIGTGSTIIAGLTPKENVQVLTFAGNGTPSITKKTVGTDGTVAIDLPTQSIVFLK